jgi:DNA topoisomerase-1
MVAKTTKTLENGTKKITRRKLKSLVTDHAKSAAAVRLRYVSDKEQGIVRVRKGVEFSYQLGGKEVMDEPTLARIKALVLPPAWEDVWICKDANGHLQATGVDARGRKQYRYHAAWSSLRSQTKFYNLYEFGKALPAIRACMDYDLARPGLPEEKVLAALLAIMQHTGIRIGNSEYEKLYGSFGLSTLKDKHVHIKGSEVKFSFRGKKGVEHSLSLRSVRLARIVKHCRDIPGEELFQYIDPEGHRRPVDSGMVNSYIKQISGGHFTAKDFRTWTGSLTALQAFREIGCSFSSATDAKRKVNTALDAVSQHLGNTRAVCRKYYVHPTILDLYECSKLEAYLKKLDAQPDVKGDGLSKEEEVLMKILEKPLSQ